MDLSIFFYLMQKDSRLLYLKQKQRIKIHYLEKNKRASMQILKIAVSSFCPMVTSITSGTQNGAAHTLSVGSLHLNQLRGIPISSQIETSLLLRQLRMIISFLLKSLIIKMILRTKMSRREKHVLKLTNCAFYVSIKFGQQNQFKSLFVTEAIAFFSKWQLEQVKHLFLQR